MDGPCMRASLASFMKNLSARASRSQCHCSLPRRPQSHGDTNHSKKFEALVANETGNRIFKLGINFRARKSCTFVISSVAVFLCAVLMTLRIKSCASCVRNLALSVSRSIIK